MDKGGKGGGGGRGKDGGRGGGGKRGNKEDSDPEMNLDANDNDWAGE